MAGKLLHEELGSRYVREFFHNAYFELGTKLYKLRTIDEATATATCHVMNLDASGYPKWDTEAVPLKELKDFTTFKYPKLGYRQFKQGKLGNIVVQVSTTRGAQRGLKDEYINYDMLPVYRTVDFGHIDGFDNINAARRVKEIYRPQFTPFSVGIKQLLDSEHLGFAVNEDLAVAVSCNTDATRAFDVYFRGRVVGEVDETGKLTVVNKILQRESLQRKLFK
jgi:hypothetical protein